MYHTVVQGLIPDVLNQSSESLDRLSLYTLLHVSIQVNPN